MPRGASCYLPMCHTGVVAMQLVLACQLLAYGFPVVYMTGTHELMRRAANHTCTPALWTADAGLDPSPPEWRVAFTWPVHMYALVISHCCHCCCASLWMVGAPNSVEKQPVANVNHDSTTLTMHVSPTSGGGCQYVTPCASDMTSCDKPINRLVRLQKSTFDMGRV
jgi:hypothetical protein